MTLYKFSDIKEEHHFLGGKAYALGLMANAGFPVPQGSVLSAMPVTESEWQEVISWWKSIGSPKLAIRSSAQGEDSGEQSFAGQNSTFLNIETPEDIKKSISQCFESINKKSSSLYREHFLKEKSSTVSMNVVLQEMVDPAFSGVFFSVDPRTSEKGWVLEAIEGYGEDLVSGKKTPYHFDERHSESSLFSIQDVVAEGLKVRNYFSYEIDMEWAIDKKKKFFVLQARPITALSGKSAEKKLKDQEIKRLTSTHDEETIWDGQTFSEWSGPPTEMTFSIWREIFAANNAFSKALQKLGYLGINQPVTNETHSLLEKIFGRAYVNLSLIAPLYYGSIPYKMVSQPRPHLKFDYHKMTFENFVLTPFTWWKMLKIGWRLSTERKTFLEECAKELTQFRKYLCLDNYEHLSDEELLVHFRQICEKFITEIQVSPLVLIILIEATNQSLKSLLKGVIPDIEIDNKLNSWMAHGLHTVTMKMNDDYRSACLDPSKRKSFLAQYGHRGPGELDLSHPRWNELGDKSFVQLDHEKTKQVNVFDVLKDINSLDTYKKISIAQEWNLLKEMLELREAWKMALLKPYAEIRSASLELARRKGIEEELIFWHDFQEICQNKLDADKANERKNQAMILKSTSLPSIVALKELKAIVEGKIENFSRVISGTPLSPGFVFGEVRVVLNPDNVDTSSWPQDTILVAESTDPGWTGLFLKSRAVLVEKGGVLSHCAIVAREMNLPAISEIKQCHLRFKDGDKIWVDGNNGHITYAE